MQLCTHTEHQLFAEPVYWEYGSLQDRLLLFKGSIGNVVVNTPASGQLGWNARRKAYMLSLMFEGLEQIEGVLCTDQMLF